MSIEDNNEIGLVDQVFAQSNEQSQEMFLENHYNKNEDNVEQKITTDGNV